MKTHTRLEVRMVARQQGCQRSANGDRCARSCGRRGAGAGPATNLRVARTAKMALTDKQTAQTRRRSTTHVVQHDGAARDAGDGGRGFQCHGGVDGPCAMAVVSVDIVVCPELPLGLA